MMGIYDYYGNYFDVYDGVLSLKSPDIDDFIYGVDVSIPMTKQQFVASFIKVASVTSR